MGHIEGLNRNQIMMTDLESLISDNNECRVIDAFCGKLDMKKIFLPTALSPRGDLQLRISSACQSRCAALRLAFLGRHLFCCAAKVGKSALKRGSAKSGKGTWVVAPPLKNLPLRLITADLFKSYLRCFRCALEFKLGNY